MVIHAAGIQRVSHYFQLAQFNMMETPVSSDSLFSQTSTLNYSQALMMGLTGHCNLQDAQQLSYSSHGNIPNIILTGAALLIQKYMESPLILQD